MRKEQRKTVQEHRSHPGMNRRTDTRQTEVRSGENCLLWSCGVVVGGIPLFGQGSGNVG